MYDFFIGIFGSIMTAAAIGLFSFVFRSLKDINTKLEATCNGNKYLLKDRITQGCSYYLRRGWIAPHEAECLMDLFSEYRKAGGNSYVHSKVEEVLKLPMEDYDKNEKA